MFCAKNERAAKSFFCGRPVAPEALPSTGAQRRRESRGQGVSHESTPCQGLTARDALLYCLTHRNESCAFGMRSLRSHHVAFAQMNAPANRQERSQVGSRMAAIPGTDPAQRSALAVNPSGTRSVVETRPDKDSDRTGETRASMQAIGQNRAIPYTKRRSSTVPCC
jgi:hypothetical protein